MNPVREPAVSGMFYPDNPAVLRKDIEDYIRSAIVPDMKECIVGIISPHAGYIYSGKVAAHAYKTIAKKPYDSVILIGPAHRAYFNGAALWNKGSFKTPLGRVDIDEDVAMEIIRTGGIIKTSLDTHRGEHSLEVQLPFLQTVLDGFKIVPIVMGTQTIGACKELVQVMSTILQTSEKRFLIVGSTDLSHYYDYAEAKRLDEAVVKCLDMFDIPGMINVFETGEAEACVAGPVIATMMLSEKLGADRGKVLKYANSGDVSGDKGSVVGYVSAVFCRTQQSERGTL
jgi:AmmeMemoRadiSam system protein B